MKIDKSLNLIVPVGDAGNEIYFHSMPILRETFEKYHRVINIAFTGLLTDGLELTGAKTAALQLRDVAIRLGVWDGKEGVKNGLIEEITRLTSIIVMGDNGWESMPVITAIQRDYVDVDDWEEAKQKIVFFILICAMTTRSVRDEMVFSMCEMWGTDITSLSCSAYIASLPILNETEILPKNENQSLVAT